MSAAQKPSLTSSLRIFMVMDATRVIGGTALVSISSSWATQLRIPETSFSSLASSASVTASRARRAMRRTVARSTDMGRRGVGCFERSSSTAPGKRQLRGIRP
jgi:hypothetical protein